MKSSGLNARKLRIILFVVMLAIIAAAIAGFYFTQKQLKEYAASISVLKADAQASDLNVQKYESIRETLEQNKDNIKKAQDIVAQSQQYQYQDQIISDLSTIGKAAKVTITSYTFSDATASATPSAPSATPTTPAPTATPAIGGGLSSRKVDVAIESPVPYSAIMDFIRRIEQNKLKMQIASVSLSKGEGNEVTSESFSIEVYVR